MLNLAKLSGKFGIFILELGSLRSGKAPGNGVDFVKFHLEFSQVIFFSGNCIGLGKSCDLSSKLINDILELLFFFYEKSVKFLCALNLGLLLVGQSIVCFLGSGKSLKVVDGERAGCGKSVDELVNLLGGSEGLNAVNIYPVGIFFTGLLGIDLDGYIFLCGAEGGEEGLSVVNFDFVNGKSCLLYTSRCV